LTTTEAIEHQKKIWHEANYDRNTKLPNRNFFERKIKEVVADAKQDKTAFAVLFIDLDDFKYVNDISGHSVGDQLLNEAANRICNCVHRDDFTARIGGDEFVIIVPQMVDILFVNGLCKTILDELRRPFKINDHVYFISASIGVSLFPRDTGTYEELLSYADQAMYQAKKLGRDRYVFFTKEIQSRINEKVNIINDLRLALNRDEFELVYQPIIDLNTSDIVKAEALIRWNHPERGLIRPDQFISIAEESGLIHALGKWILKRVIFDLRELHQHFGVNFNVAINISPIQFTQPQNFIDFLQEIDSEKISPSVISFEITEGLLLTPSEIVTNTISLLKNKGVKFSIDDFGTGYSALAYLKSFDIDYLKIDKAFTRELESDLYNSSLCQFVILLAHNLGIQVIAEGVEHQMQETILKKLGCDFVQGYFYGRPMSILELVKLKSV
jgi:diguanylate cyclase (GGDEF)-like protein